MKQLIRVVVLVLALLLLTGCGNSSNPKEDIPGPSIEPPLPTADTDPSAPTANASDAITTKPTNTVPVETTAPTVAATIPAETSPAETTAPTTATPNPTESAPMETIESTELPAAQAPAATAGFDAVYAEICCLLDTGSWDLDYAYANAGIMEVVGPQGTKEERYGSITYALEDINNDNILEMIVLDAMGNTRILAIYAIQNGQPVLTHEGGYRARLYRLSDGTFYYEGSNGAAYSIFKAYGQCWFTYPKGEEQLEIGRYFAADGSYDPNEAEEITSDEYNAKQAELAQMITAFSVYNFS